MTNQELILKAYNTHCSDWDTITSLIQQATDDETRERLRTIQKSKYHTDEHRCGLD